MRTRAIGAAEGAPPPAGRCRSTAGAAPASACRGQPPHPQSTPMPETGASPRPPLPTSPDPTTHTRPASGPTRAPAPDPPTEGAVAARERRRPAHRIVEADKGASPRFKDRPQKALPATARRSMPAKTTRSISPRARASPADRRPGPPAADLDDPRVDSAPLLRSCRARGFGSHRGDRPAAARPRGPSPPAHRPRPVAVGSGLPKQTNFRRFFCLVSSGMCLCLPRRLHPESIA